MTKLVLPLLLVLGAGVAAAEETAPAADPARGTELTVRGTPGAVLRVDDKPVGRLPLAAPLVLPAGPHRFQLERQGQRFESDILTIPEGRIAELSLTAGSAGTAVAVLSLTPMLLLAVRGRELDEPGKQALRTAVQIAAQAEHVVLVPGETMAQVQRGLPADCLTQPACQLRFATAAEARLVLRLELPAVSPATPGNSTTVRGELVDVKTGQSAVRGEQPYGGSDAQLGEAAQQLTRFLVSAAAKVARGIVVVSSQPDAAQVTIDGQARGVTPWEGASFPGPHEVLIEKPNYTPYHTQITVAAEQSVKLDVELIALPVAPVPPPLVVAPTPLERRPRPRWRLISGGIALGLGVVVTGLGIAGVAKEGACADSPPPDLGNCNYLYATAGLGGAGIGVGLSLAAAGAVLLALPGPQATKTDGITK